MSKQINLTENKKIQPRVEKCTDPKKLDQKSNFLEVGIFMSKYTFELKKKVIKMNYSLLLMLQKEILTTLNY